jgi:hypothetical protein
MIFLLKNTLKRKRQRRVSHFWHRIRCGLIDLFREHIRNGCFVMNARQAPFSEQSEIPLKFAVMDYPFLIDSLCPSQNWLASDDKEPEIFL